LGLFIALLKYDVMSWRHFSLLVPDVLSRIEADTIKRALNRSDHVKYFAKGSVPFLEKQNRILEQRMQVKMDRMTLTTFLNIETFQN